MTTEADYMVPEVTTRFPGPLHPGLDEITRDTQRFYDRFVRATLVSDHEDLVGSYVDCGGTYVSYIYPTGLPEPMKLVARMYGPWALVDDVIDNSESLPFIRDFAAMFRRTLQGKPVADARFRGIWELFAADGWDTRVLDLVRHSLHRYMEATIDIRTIEIRRSPVTLDDYFELRRWNDAMPAMCYFGAYVDPALRDPVLEARDHPSFERAVTCTGIATGILLDLCNINRGPQETCRYTNTARIIARADAGLDWPRAVATAIDCFHEYEDKMAAALDELRVAYPEVSTLLAHVQGGTVRWLTMMRNVGRRYGKLDEVI
jgi:hypothetical protein